MKLNACESLNIRDACRVMVIIVGYELSYSIAHLAGAVEYTDCFSAEG